MAQGLEMGRTEQMVQAAAVALEALKLTVFYQTAVQAS
jgi:hypothetical protein